MTSDVDQGAGYISFGPLGDKLPSAFTATVDYAERPVTMTVHVTFDGRRARVDKLIIESKNGREVTPRDVAGLQLGEVVRDATRARITPGAGLAVDRRPDRRPTPDELQLVAGVYWAHYVMWGDPRRAVMAIWDIPRATANRWLRRCRELYDMPEVD
ncbi:hypothetical protein Acsp04_05030 [Actinomadura sp. NBRC 104425]|nr:hypothetical protein Acsp04_05030 [Actinomadura sp. NBRC 104425]